MMIPLIGPRADGRSAVIDEADGPIVLAHTWRPTAKGYATAAIKDDAGIWHTTSMHRFILGLPRLSGPGAPICGVVDHINGDRLDNRRENLRITTQSENRLNSKAKAGSESGISGVCRHHGRWAANWKVGGVREWRHFDTMEEAIACRLRFNASSNLIGAGIA